MSFQLTIVDDTWGEAVPIGQPLTTSDLPTAKRYISLWTDAQVKRVRKDGLRPTVDVLPFAKYPASSVVSWVEQDELVVTLLVLAIEVKD